MIKVGEPFPLDADDVGNCPATYARPLAEAYCVLDEGHAGPHVATDGEKVVEVWT